MIMALILKDQIADNATMIIYKRGSIDASLDGTSGINLGLDGINRGVVVCPVFIDCGVGKATYCVAVTASATALTKATPAYVLRFTRCIHKWAETLVRIRRTGNVRLAGVIRDISGDIFDKLIGTRRRSAMTRESPFWSGAVQNKLDRQIDVTVSLVCVMYFTIILPGFPALPELTPLEALSCNLDSVGEDANASMGETAPTVERCVLI